MLTEALLLHCSRSYSTLSVASSRSSLFSENPQLLEVTTPEPGAPASPNQITEGESGTLPVQPEGVGTGTEITSQVADGNDTITSLLANETAEAAHLPEISIQSEIPESETMSSAANQNRKEEILTSSLPNEIAEKQEEDEFGDFQEGKTEVVASQDSSVTEPPTRDDHLSEPLAVETVPGKQSSSLEEAGNSQESGAAAVSGGEGVPGEFVAMAIMEYAWRDGTRKNSCHI